MALKILTQPNTGKTFRMGRKRSVARGPRLSLRNYLIAGQEPTPPPSGTYATAAAVSLSNIYENDTLGDCVIAAMGHMEGIMTGNANPPPLIFTNQQIINLYSEIGGYIPGDPSTDQGCDEVTALNTWMSKGLIAPTAKAVLQGAHNPPKPAPAPPKPDPHHPPKPAPKPPAPAPAPVAAPQHQIAGWLAVDPANAVLALWLFENLMFGVELPDAWISPFPSASGFVWDVAGNPDPDNGHAFCGTSWSPTGIGIATWGMEGTITNAAIAKYAAAQGEGALYTAISQDALNSATEKAPNGFDFAQLMADFQAIGSTVQLSAA